MIRVAGYCRVSTDQADQANSFSSQCRFFREYVLRVPEWELVNIYADEGITGTSTQKRVQFNQMMDDAIHGKIQMILTKEISRFSRNILDTIRYTRMLRDLGIGVYFLTDGICSLDADAELRLSILGSIAQEESRRTSQRVKWGQTRQMERGVVFGPSLLGYSVNNGIMEIKPGEADTVRYIFQLYADGATASKIAEILEERGHMTRAGSAKWNRAHIIKILHNEKYVGDLVQKKTVTPDYLTHRKVRNLGQEAMICIRDHHEPIISRELWEQVQQRFGENDRHGRTAAAKVTCAFAGKVHCEKCGKTMVTKSRKRKDGTVYRYLSCHCRQVGEAVFGEMMGCVLNMLPLEDLIRPLQGILSAARKVTGEDRADQILTGTKISYQALIQDISVLEDGIVRIRLSKLPCQWIFRLKK